MISKSYINENCAFLEAEMESPWDTYLVQLVRIQQLASDVDATIYQDSSSGEPQTSHFLLTATSNMERQVQELGTTLHQQPRLQGKTIIAICFLKMV
jgi:hypothetical protein